MAQPIIVSPTSTPTDWSTLMGVTTAILGLFLIVYPLVRGALTTTLFGCVLFLVCIAQVVFGVHSQSLWKFLLIALRGALFGIAGVWLVFSPPAEAETLTALLMAMLLAGAGIEGGLALLLRPDKGRGWVVSDAVAGFLMGALILAGWPASSVVAMGALVGVAVLVNGICRVVITSEVQREARKVEKREREYRRAA